MKSSSSVTHKKNPRFLGDLPLGYCEGLEPFLCIILIILIEVGGVFDVHITMVDHDVSFGFEVGRYVIPTHKKFHQQGLFHLKLIVGYEDYPTLTINSEVEGV